MTDRPERLHIYEATNGWIVCGPRGGSFRPRVFTDEAALGRYVSSWAADEDVTLIDDALGSLTPASDVTLVPSEIVRLEMTGGDKSAW